MEKQSELKNMSDVLNELKAKNLVFGEIESVENSKLVGETFVIQKVEFMPSTFGGEFAVILFELGNKQFQSMIGSKVVVEQLKKTKDLLPIRSTLVKKKAESGRIYLSLA